MKKKPRAMLPEWKKGRARLNPTIAALLRRGVDNESARKLQGEEWTLAKLQQQSVRKLGRLGLRPDWISNIQASDRPAIPFDIAARVLIASNFTCCVCHDPSRGVILHHIVEWTKSHDHSEPNLAVLCLQDHDRAHSRLAHTQNLTPQLIRKSKNEWQNRIALSDTWAILTATSMDFDCWWYFNRTRLFAMADDLNTSYRTLSRFSEAFGDGWINSKGHIVQDGRRTRYSLEGGDGGSLYAYLSEILDRVISSASIMNISDDLDRRLLSAVLEPRHLIFLQGAFKFAEQTDVLRGQGQTTEMYRQTNGVRVTCTFDRWEATSNSSWSVYLKGSQEAAALLRVVSLNSDGGVLVVQASVIAISAPQHDLKHREYSNSPYRRGYYTLSEEEL